MVYSVLVCENAFCNTIFVPEQLVLFPNYICLESTENGNFFDLDNDIMGKLANVHIVIHIKSEENNM